jgi:hypothetical protein
MELIASEFYNSVSIDLEYLYFDSWATKKYRKLRSSDLVHLEEY